MGRAQAARYLTQPRSTVLCTSSPRPWRSFAHAALRIDDAHRSRMAGPIRPGEENSLHGAKLRDARHDHRRRIKPPEVLSGSPVLVVDGRDDHPTLAFSGTKRHIACARNGMTSLRSSGPPGAMRQVNWFRSSTRTPPGRRPWPSRAHRSRHPPAPARSESLPGASVRECLCSQLDQKYLTSAGVRRERPVGPP